MPHPARLALPLLWITACGAPAPARTPEPPRIFATVDGRAVSFEALLDALMDARVIYVGEHHDRAADHRAQAAILEGLHARDASLALGVEMVQQPHQGALDAFVAGGLDERGLLEGLEWERRWGVDFALYRPLFVHARRYRVPLVALNAPTELTRAIARAGLDALDPQQRASLPELDLEDETHRAMIGAVLRQHPGLDDAGFERYYAAQVVWDETMADGVARTLSERTSSGREAPARMLVLAGAMHVRPVAIPERAARRGARPYAIVLPVRQSELDEARRADPPIADFLWMTPDE